MIQMYQLMDKMINQLLKKISKRFRRFLATTTFDELNIISGSKKLYGELEKLNFDVFLELAQASYKKANPKCEGKDNPIDKKWLIAFLLGYNAVTKYVYSHESDRKRARFAEALIASVNKNKETDTARKLWERQTKQYGISVIDAATLQAYEDMGIKRVRWRTKNDAKVCKECAALNGRVFKLRYLPDKPHYNCRCWYEPVEEEHDD